MARILVLLTITLSGLFALVIQVVGGLAYDAGYFQAVASFLTPPQDCPPPCFMGIRPGTTTADQAIAILKHHPWVDKVTVAADLENSFSGSIYWTWGASLPPQIDPSWEGHLFIIGRMVRNIWVRTNLQYGDVLLLYGVPESGGLAAIDRAYLQHRAIYVGRGLETESYVACPLHLEQIWGAAVVMNIRLTTTDVVPPSGYAIANWLETSPCRLKQ